ncbi:SMC family ATPase [Thermodesulfobacterium sp. TA1]|uniref:AAA family ATPase n=1 Tax=Thermodesulfobacterium sp. TA1 TaxID=2234087 RepID=UPI001231B806|nr:SMC family ATPase [Thermodesulfobacterium sp. TA1]QER41329.1 SMC family ATPase [Thermodesulfobacterium sp. TA1]
MRPLFLSIKGLGPYLSVQISEEVFKELNENRLFLISGEIGAGKTTLFDAIVYALYGSTTINKRDPKSLISTLTKNHSEVIPEVEFKFFLDGQVYRIKRRFPYEGKPKKVSLWIEESFFSDKEQEINHKIQELIGLNADQFKKVFLIPQGEYRNILLTNTNEREELFKTIFDTFMFVNLEEFLKQRLKDLKAQLQSLLDQEKQLKELVKVEKIEDLENKIRDKKNRLLSLESQANKLAKEKEFLTSQILEQQNLLSLIKKYQEILKTLKNLDALEEEIKQKEKRLEILKRIKEYLPFYENVNRLKQEILDKNIEIKDLLAKEKSLSQILVNLSKKLEFLLEQAPEIEKLKIKVANQKQLKERIVEKNFLEKEVKKLSYEVEKKEQEVRSIQEKIKKLKAHLEEIYEKRNLLLKIQSLLKDEERLRDLAQKFNHLKTILEKKPEIEEKIASISQEIHRLEREKRDLEIKNLALAVSQFLEKDKPCPVCGSTHHPAPIKDENFTERLKKIELALKNKNAELEKTKTYFDKLEGKLEHLKKELLPYKDKEEEILQKLTEIDTQKSRHLDLISLYQNHPSSIQELESLSQTLKETLNQNEEKEKELSGELESKKQKLLGLKGRLEGLLNDLKGQVDTLEALKAKIDHEEKIIAKFENQKKQVEQDLKNYSIEKTAVAQDLKNQKEFLQHLLKNYKDQILKILPLKRQNLIKQLYEFETLKTEIAKIQNLEAEINEFYQKKEKLKAEKEEIERELKILSQETLEELEKKIAQALEALNQKKKNVEDLFTKVNQEIGMEINEIEKFETILSSYQGLEKNLKKTEQECRVLGKLVDLISGKNLKGISFHSFVVSMFAKLIFQRANTYLWEFSFGRYKFLEEIFLQKRGSIEIFDYFTGDKREVKTLSGGESFIATLALALGTSDVITYLFKAKPFESLFIDEGFGSLDENTLNKVIEILLNLSEKSGRIIGIISHLKEMKESFPLVLEVLKDPVSGSKINLIRKLPS